MRIVVDTNVFISSLFSEGGKPRRAVNLCVQSGGGIRSRSTTEELRDKFGGTKLTKRHDKFLALALDGRAETIVTGDEDLLVLHPWRGVRIVRPAAFLESSAGGERERG